MLINNIDFEIIKGRIDIKLNSAFKKVLAKLNITQQDFIEDKVKEFVIQNINLILPDDDK